MKPRLKTIVALAVMALAIYPSMRLVGPAGDDEGAVSATTGWGQLWGNSERRTADGLLRRARKALDENNLELAEWYLQRVEKLDVDYSGVLQGKDTPKQLRAELEQRRADQRLQAAPPSPPKENRGGAEPPSAQFAAAPVEALIPPRERDQGASPAPAPREVLETDVNQVVDQLVGSAPAEMGPAEAGLGPAPAELGLAPVPAANSEYVSTGLAPPPGAPVALPPVDASASSEAPVRGDLSREKSYVLSLLARARAALDRGDVQSAEGYTLQAKAMGLPDEVFAPGESRPAMLMMEIDRHKARLASRGDLGNPTPGLAQAGFEQPQEIPPYLPAHELMEGFDPLEPQAGAARIADTSPPTVVTSPPIAGGINQPAQLLVPLDEVPPQVAQAPANGGRAAASGGPALLAPPAMPDTFASPTPAASPAHEFYQQGLAALKQHDVSEARRLFKQAWSLRDQLDEATIQRLQDHLQGLSGPATLSADDELDMGQPLDQLAAAEQEEVRKLLELVTREHAAIRGMREQRPSEAWQRSRTLRETIAKANIDSDAQQQLLARVDRLSSELEEYITSNKAMIELDERNRAVLDEIERTRQLRIRTQQQLAEFVEQFNTLIEQQRFPEAMVVARKARELDPRNPVVQNMVWKAQTARELTTNIMRSERFQQQTLATLGDVDESAVPFPDNLVTEFPRDWEQLSNDRLGRVRQEQTRYSEAELQIKQALKKPVDVNFENVPLAEALDQLGRMAGINVFLDPAGLEAERVSSDTTVNLPLRKPVSLQSALNLILEPLHLSYVIQNEVLRITSMQVREGVKIERIYYVADLVLPIPNFAPSYNMGLPGAIKDGFVTAGYGTPAGAVTNTPFTITPGHQGAAAAPQGTSPLTLAQMGQSGIIPTFGSGSAQPLGLGPGGPGGGTQADFEPLIELIEKTIEPTSWDAAGGTGSLEGFPTNLSLVVSQTLEVHEKISDLLDQLRRLQDLQVTIEVRFITLADDFFERIGVDFDFDIDDNTGLLAGEITQIDDSGPSVTVGLDPVTRAPRADLDIGFGQGSFGATIPVFGGYEPNAAASVGFAILSDLEAFFVIEAVQGDTRTNVLQAPKVTLFNGQQAFVSDTSQRPFVTSVIPVVGDFAAAHQPVITVLTEGTSLSVQAVASQDRRFVRLTLVPFFSRIGDVDTFTFNGRTDSDSGTTAVDPTDEENTVRNNERTTMVGTTVQLPTFAFTTVNTTVSVPDGGTILLGGIKRLSEGRNERGVPILSKLPYINRLFKNVGIGRETSSLMMMVTPRIIIQEEEEELQTGYQAP